MNKEAIGTLTGKFFHSVKTDRVTIEWQGKFLGLASPGLYRIQTYNWLTGGEDEQLLVPAVDMRYWKIYETEEQMRTAYENYHRQREAIAQRDRGIKASSQVMAAADLIIQDGRVIKSRDGNRSIECADLAVIDGVVIKDRLNFCGGAK